MKWKLSLLSPFIATLLLSTGALSAQGSLQIASAEPDLDQGTIIISGRGFGDTAPFLGTVSLFVPNDVELPVVDFDPVAQEITAMLPVGIEDTPGTFLLVVSTADDDDDDDADFAAFGVTIGAVGPQGDAGPQGPPGAGAPPGPTRTGAP